MWGGIDDVENLAKSLKGMLKKIMISRDAIIWTLGAWFGGSLIGLIMSIIFAIIVSRMERP